MQGHSKNCLSQLQAADQQLSRGAARVSSSSFVYYATVLSSYKPHYAYFPSVCPSVRLSFQYGFLSKNKEAQKNKNGCECYAPQQ